MTWEDRFWARVDKSGDCWVWTAYTSVCGYGQCYLNNKTWLAHRASWVIHNGPIPDGLCVLHKCDNPPCVNPDHLYVGTKKDNTRDMIARNRGPSRVGAINGNAKLCDLDIWLIRELAPKFTRTAIAQWFGVTRVQISTIALRKQWTHL